MSGDSLVRANTTGSQDGGGIVINSDYLLVEESSDVLANVSGSGQGGSITLNTSQLVIQNGARVRANTFGEGNSGEIIVNATDSVEVSGTSADGQFFSFLATQARPNSTGDAGDLTINTLQLLIQNGAGVSANTFGEGNGGNININATDSVEVSGTSADGRSRSLLSAQARPNATGDAGDLTINTSQLLIQGGARVSTGTFGEGNGGNLTVNATSSVEVSGTSADSRSRSLLSAEISPGSTADAGDLTINTSQLFVQGGARVSVNTSGDGDAGNLTIQAEEIELVGFTSLERSGLFASAINGGTGNGGNINIETDKLTVRNGAIISVSNFHSQGLLPPGQGNVGNININSETIILDDGGITATGNTAIGGNITLNISDYILLLNGNGTLEDVDGDGILDENTSLALISADSLGNGGNITLNTTALIAIPGQDSDITANSVGGLGGLIEINADAVFGIQERDKDLSGSNDITVISGLGSQFSGQVIFNTPQTNPQNETTEEPKTVADDSDLIIQSACSDFGGDSQLANTGRGGIPQIPGLIPRNSVINIDLVDEVPPVPPAPPAEAIKPHHRTDVTFIDSEGEEFKPAMGAVLLPNGMVEFVDYSPAEVYRDMYAAAGCLSNK